MEWLIFWFVLEMGYLPLNDFAIYECNNTDIFYIDMQTRIYLWDFYVGGGIKNIICSKVHLSPNKITYLFQLGWNNDFIEIGFRHYCIHPIIPYMSNKKITINYEGAYEEIFIKLEGKIGL